MKRILDLLHQGQAVRQAGDRVGLSTKTVQTGLRTVRLPVIDGRLADVSLP